MSLNASEVYSLLSGVNMDWPVEINGYPSVGVGVIFDESINTYKLNATGDPITVGALLSSAKEISGTGRYSRPVTVNDVDVNNVTYDELREVIVIS